ncbi:NADPH-dependent ferric siderophore reductase [Rhodococcus sp. 27YEA15]|uniref:hypothetical protein n=1 Tax=Rhodococcus sp. 27YEA15 TaxID=3156259 RepID=UPI003C7E310B
MNASVANAGPVLPPGMVMTVAAVTGLERDGSGFVHVRLEADAFAHAQPSGAAPVFKLFIPQEKGAHPPLPSFDAKYLPSWGDQKPPTVRSYTAVGFTPGSTVVAFTAVDRGAEHWWLDRCAVGDQLGFIGFRHEVVVPPSVSTVVAVGDVSAFGAVAALSRQDRDDVNVHAVLPTGSQWPEGLSMQRPQRVSTVAAGSTGFPRGSWADISGTAAVTESDCVLWLGGELAAVAALHADAVAAGLDPSRIFTQPYWRKGRTRDEFDGEMSILYQGALAAGEDISDRVTATRIELSAALCTSNTEEGQY